MRILRAADRIAIPWKNGGGVTREVCAVPPGTDFGFDWRFSLAAVHSAGAFSRFPGIDRSLAVIQGRMRLAIDGKWSAELSSDTPALPFAGEAETFAEVILPVSDANLMVRRDQFVGTLDRIQVDQEITIIEPVADMIVLAVDPIRVANTELRDLDAIWCEAGYLIEARPITSTAVILVAKIWPR